MLKKIDMNLIDVEQQVRFNFIGIKELALSIKSDGLQQPITVIQRGARYLLDKGERRFRAHEYLGAITIMAIVLERVPPKGEMLTGQLIENIQRDNLKPVEIGIALKKIMAEQPDLTKRDLATNLGKSPSYITKHLACADLPDCIVGMLERVKCCDVEMLYLLRMFAELNEEECRFQCFKASEKHPLTRKDLKTLISVEKNKIIKKRAKKHQARKSVEFVGIDLEDRVSTIKATECNTEPSVKHPPNPPARVHIEVEHNLTKDRGTICLDQASANPDEAYVLYKNHQYPIREELSELKITRIKHF